MYFATVVQPPVLRCRTNLATLSMAELDSYPTHTVPSKVGFYICICTYTSIFRSYALPIYVTAIFIFSFNTTPVPPASHLYSVPSTACIVSSHSLPLTTATLFSRYTLSSVYQSVQLYSSHPPPLCGLCYSIPLESLKLLSSLLSV